MTYNMEMGKYELKKTELRFQTVDTDDTYLQVLKVPDRTGVLKANFYL